MKLSEMKNIGKNLEQMLMDAGIKDSEMLKEIGTLEAANRLKNDMCYNKLYALEGAILDVRWHNLSKEHKSELKRAYDEMVK